MSKKIENKYDVIDQFFAAQLSANESEATNHPCPASAGGGSRAGAHCRARTAAQLYRLHPLPRIQDPRATTEEFYVGEEHHLRRPEN